MNLRSGRKWLPMAAVCLLFTGVFGPIAILGQSGSASPSQLAGMIAAAESSREYAVATIALASIHGLSVGASQAQLTQGDSLLATAKADAESGVNLAAGIAAVQAAMSDYASAAASASLALTNAGLTAEVYYNAAVSAVAEVNATASVAASIVAQACGSVVASSSNSSGLAQACAQASAQLSDARAHVSQADSLLAGANGQTGANANVSEALSFVAQARAEVNASMSALLTISSYGYTQRALAYIAAVVSPLSAKANQTITTEQSTMVAFAQMQAEFAAYSKAQASGTANVTQSASALSSAIALVNTQAVSSSITSAQSTEAQLGAQLSALLGISGILALSNIVNDIQACQAATSSYNSSLNVAESQSAAYTQTRLGSFSGYVNTMDADASSVQTTGSAYVSSYQTLVAALDAPGVLSISGVQAIYNTLISLQVSGSVGSVNSALQSETSAMGTVSSDINSYTSVVAASSVSIIVNNNLYSNALGVSNQSQQFLNATGTAAVAAASSSFLTTVQTAEAFMASANASTGATIGGFATAATSLASAGASLGSQTQASVSALATAYAYIASDEYARAALASSGQMEVSEALQLFSVQNVSGGVAAMAQASFDFQAASSAGA